MTSDGWRRLRLAPRVVAPADPATGHAIVLAAIEAGADVAAAVSGDDVVGLAVSGSVTSDWGRPLLALGVAPDLRRRGLASRLLAASTADRAEVTVAERDPLEPLDVDLRMSVARRLLGSAGFDVGLPGGTQGSAQLAGIVATRG
jgi:GNAT superfamily N-acetyltransferase